MKTIGILGGMGPLATADIFKKIITMTEADSDNEHIRIVVENNTEIPDRTAFILKGGEDPTSHIVKSAMRLEMMGSDVIVMPCNTAHFFYDEVVKYIKTPFINMIEETAKEIKALYPGKKTALLATEGTYESGIYDKVFADYGLELIKPANDNVKHVMDLIYDIKGGKSDIKFDDFLSLLEEMKLEGAEAFILGCTELPIAFEMFKIREETVDPTKILACSSIKFVGKKVRRIDLSPSDNKGDFNQSFAC